jgi:hypothetical protein
MFLIGLYFFIGVTGILKFFTKKGNNNIYLGKIKGSISYFTGFLVIIFGFPFLGSLLQMGGFFLIFRSFLP